MTVETIKDILDWTRNLHVQLEEVYRTTSDETDSERTKMLLSYVADHEAKLAEAIEHYEKDVTVNMIDTWVQDYIMKNPFMQGMMTSLKFAGMSGDEILNATLSSHQHLINLYKDLAESAQTKQLQELFENMQSLEMHELMRMVHTTERFNDL